MIFAGKSRVQGVSWRKKLALLAVVLIVTIVVLVRQRNSAAIVLEQLSDRLRTCTQHADSLVTQLDGKTFQFFIAIKRMRSAVLNRYKLTVERMMSEQSNRSEQQIAGKAIFSPLI